MLDLRRCGGPRRLVALTLHFRRFLRVGGLRFEALLFDGRIAEHQHGPRHVPELVAAVGAGYFDVVVALCQRRHRVDELPDGTRDGEHDKHANGAGNNQHAERHHQQDPESPLRFRGSGLYRRHEVVHETMFGAVEGIHISCRSLEPLLAVDGGHFVVERRIVGQLPHSQELVLGRSPKRVGHILGLRRRCIPPEHRGIRVAQDLHSHELLIPRWRELAGRKALRAERARLRGKFPAPYVRGQRARLANDPSILGHLADGIDDGDEA